MRCRPIPTLLPFTTKPGISNCKLSVGKPDEIEAPGSPAVRGTVRQGIVSRQQWNPAVNFVLRRIGQWVISVTSVGILRTSSRETWRMA
jgi:hypothetical protein